MAVLMPNTQEPMNEHEQNAVAALSGAKDGLRREEIAQHVFSPNSSAEAVDAAISALIQGGAVDVPDDSGRYRLTRAGRMAALTGEFGR